MKEIPVEKIIRSRRKTLALEVTPAATLIVRAPLRASTACIEEMIRQKRTWILRKLDAMKQRPRSACHEYTEGELFLFLGRLYPLHFVEGGGMTIERSDRLYVPRTLVPHIRDQLKRWYIEEARKELKARACGFPCKRGIIRP